VPYALFSSPMPPTPFTPALYVDIGATFERKMAALACHESQHKFLAQHHRTDIFRQIESAARLHGATCGVDYAEAFALVERFTRLGPIQTLARFFPKAGE
jgi:N-acetylglucosamine malate deacetylase 1